jgi:hypothetical protein
LRPGGKRPVIRITNRKRIKGAGEIERRIQIRGRPRSSAVGRWNLSHIVRRHRGQIVKRTNRTLGGGRACRGEQECKQAIDPSLHNRAWKQASNVRIFTARQYEWK